MNPYMFAARAGLRRGLIELRQTFTTPMDLWTYVFPPTLITIVMLIMRDSTVGDTGFSLGTRTLPGAIGMGVAFGGLMTLAAILVTEREDGTLLRAKAIPNGMIGYLAGKLLLVTSMTMIGVVLQLVPGVLLFDGLALDDPGGWLTLAWVLALGLLATLPLGAVAGSLLSNPRNMGLIMLPLGGLIAISGIFYPIDHYPGWLQAIAQVFPMYWLGLGTRSALLPDSMAAVEFGQSWRHLETFGVLSVWAVAGLIIAPIILRRMARRESGSTVAARREKAMQRIN